MKFLTAATYRLLTFNYHRQVDDVSILALINKFLAMAEYIKLGKVSAAAIRNYLIEKRIDKGDSLVFNPTDFEGLIDDIKESGEPIDIPVSYFGVRILKNDEVPVGKFQIVKNESTIN